jgi:hypothetical protein
MPAHYKLQHPTLEAISYINDNEKELIRTNSNKF